MVESGTKEAAVAEKKKFIDDVLMVLEIGAEGRYTEDELKEKMGVHEVDLQGVHVFGARGIFERGAGEKLRLNMTGLNLLMTHRSIEQAKQQAEQAKQQALIATWISMAAVVLTFLALAWSVYSRLG